jgi:hypothetical protein
MTLHYGGDCGSAFVGEIRPSTARRTERVDVRLYMPTARTPEPRELRGNSISLWSWMVLDKHALALTRGSGDEPHPATKQVEAQTDNGGEDDGDDLEDSDIRLCSAMISRGRIAYLTDRAGVSGRQLGRSPRQLDGLWRRHESAKSHPMWEYFP